MEDLSTTSSAFSKDELAVFARHPVVSKVEAILDIKKEIDDIGLSNNFSVEAKQEDIREKFNDMTKAWGSLGPSRALARRLFVSHSILFDILDKSLDIESALDDMVHARDLVIARECTSLCCKKLL